jgi:hypothetical protein
MFLGKKHIRFTGPTTRQLAVWYYYHFYCYDYYYYSVVSRTRRRRRRWNRRAESATWGRKSCSLGCDRIYVGTILSRGIRFLLIKNGGGKSLYLYYIILYTHWEGIVDGGDGGCDHVPGSSRGKTDLLI